MPDYRCTCGHTEREHLWPPPESRRFTSGLISGGCAADGCACKVFRRDRDYIPESKALTPREKREHLTHTGAAWLTRAAEGLGRDSLQGLGWSDSLITRVRRAIVDAAPFREGDTLERIKGGELGDKAWRTLLAVMRERDLVFGDDKPCPLCGRKGAP